jgi:protein involved in polysaccharide export with SLBB domain
LRILFYVICKNLAALKTLPWNRISPNRLGLISPAGVIILGWALFLGWGCGGTPEPRTDPESIEAGKLFYSRAEDTAEEPESGSTAETATADLVPIPDEGDSYLINPHDLIEVSVLGESDLSLSVRVSERGMISFPLLGEVRAAGYSPIQFERRLEDLLEEDYLVSPSVNVTIREYGTISVLGQVQKPGSFEIKGRLTVTRAIAQAGGLTSTASPNGTRIIRKYSGREEIIPVRLNDILKDGDLAHDIPLRPGDLIVVPESFF